MRSNDLGSAFTGIAVIIVTTSPSALWGSGMESARKNAFLGDWCQVADKIVLEMLPPSG